MASINVNAAKSKIKHIQAGSTKIKSAHVYQGGAFKKVWSGGSAVSYYNGSTLIGTVEVEEGKDVLRPSLTFSKSGYTHIGWSKTNGGAIVTSLVATGDPMTLYAVWAPNTLTVLSAEYGSSITTINIKSQNSAYVSGEFHSGATANWNTTSGNEAYITLSKGIYQTAKANLLMKRNNVGQTGYLSVGYVDRTYPSPEEQLGEIAGAETISIPNIVISGNSYKFRTTAKSYDAYSQYVATIVESIVLSNPKKWS